MPWRFPVWWKVRSFDSDGLPGPWSDSVFFEIGLLDVDDWQGRWISAGLQGSRITRVPVPVLTRAFDLPAEIRSARLYVAAFGEVAVQVNGQRQGSLDLPPGWGDYAERTEYPTFDISECLHEGSNSVAVLLADGCYAGDLGTGYRQQYGDRPRLLVQLNVTLADGERRQICTDSLWRWQPSWILGADPVAGESVAGPLARADWAGDLEATGWYPVELGEHQEALDVELTAAPGAISEGEELAGELIGWVEQRSAALFRFPQPLIGRARVTMTVPDGAAIKIRYGLEVDSAMALVGPVSEDLYTAVGVESGEVFEALFGHHGFQYVEVSGEFYRDDAVAVVARTVGRKASNSGRFIADHPRLNRLHSSMTSELKRIQSCFPLSRLPAGQRLSPVAEFGAAIGGLMLSCDAAALASTLTRLFADEGLRARLSQGALRAVQDFSVQHHVEEMGGLYERVARRFGIPVSSATTGQAAVGQGA